MYITISHSEFKSANKRNQIKVKNYNLVHDDLKGIVIVLHGMCECKEIYSEFAEYLAIKGYGVITYDHIGHGGSINNIDEQGFFANEKGYEYLVEDLKYVINEAKKFKKPVFLFGHSMGSIIARAYVAQEKKQEIDGLILCGTVGPQWAIDGAIQLAEYMVEQKGPRYRSRKLQQLIMQVASWKFENMEYKLEWITRDKKYIEKIKDDEKMNFIFTATGFRDVFLLTKLTGLKENIEKIPKELPIFLISGSDDVLGEYGEGIKRLYEVYKKNEIKDVTIKLYPKSRHNLMQEIERKQVEKDVYEWIEIVRLATKE